MHVLILQRKVAVLNCNTCLCIQWFDTANTIGCMSRGRARMSTVAGHLASDARAAAGENGATKGWDPLVVTPADLDGFKGDNAFGQAHCMQIHEQANNLSTARAPVRVRLGLSFALHTIYVHCSNQRTRVASRSVTPTRPMVASLHTAPTAYARAQSSTQMH
jgi:hypothetical protein